MKNKPLAAGICILLLLTGCSGNAISEQETAETSVSEDMVSENTVSGNSVILDISEDDIVNRDGVLDDFWTGYQDAAGKITVDSYNDQFPGELQDLLIACNDDMESDIDWEKYAADYDVIGPEDAEDKNIPYDEILAVAGKMGSYADGTFLLAFDVDADGDDEYEVIGSVGTGWQTQTLIIKYVESEWVVIGGGVGPEDTSKHMILEYEGRYYLLFGNVLAYWNDEIECPDLSYWERDGILGYDDCWNELEIQKTVISYTPYEIYTNPQDDTTDYLEDVDLETLRGNDAEDVAIESNYWNIDDFHLTIEDSWLSHGEEQYLYVITDTRTGRNDKSEDDRILITLHQTEDEVWEITKVYYMVADYDIQLRMRRSQ